LRWGLAEKRRIDGTRSRRRRRGFNEKFDRLFNETRFPQTPCRRCLPSKNGIVDGERVCPPIRSAPSRHRGHVFIFPSWNYTRIGLLRNNVLERTPAPGRDMFSSRILLSIPSRQIDSRLRTIIIATTTRTTVIIIYLSVGR